MGYNNNAAYDIGTVRKLQDDRKLKVLEGMNKELQSEKKATKAMFKVFGIAIVILAMLSVGIYNQVLISETTSLIEKENKNLNELINEQVRMNMDIESKISFRNLDEYAKSSLGLSAPETYQINRIKITAEKEISITKNQNQGFIESIVETFKGWFGIV